MPIRHTKTDAYADLGDVWLRNQLARLAQLHLRFGGHYRIDADSLLAGWARTARAAQAAAGTKVSTKDRIWQATVEVIEHYSISADHFDTRSTSVGADD